MTSSWLSSTRNQAIVLALLTAASLLPFVGKPFHVDDPITIWVAQQIRAHPLDFYNFPANWYGVKKPMHEMAKSPPLGAYYAAMVLGVARGEGDHEVALHLAFMLPAIALVLGTFALARELNVPAMPAALLTLFTPVFLLCATSVMYDVMLVAFYVWAIWAWVRGIERDRVGVLYLAAVLITLSAMTKYFGISLLPLLAVYAAMRKRQSPARWVVPLLLPVLVLLFYQVFTRRMYGRGLLSDAVGYAGGARERGGQPLAAMIVNGLSFVGGCCITAALAMLIGMRRRSLLLWIIGGVGVIAAMLWIIDPIPRFSLHGERGVLLGDWLQLSLFVTAGLIICVAAINVSREQRNAQNVLLLFWILGTFAFAAIFNWTANGRSVLPLAPAAGILAARAAARANRALLGVVVVIGAVVSLLCAYADQSHARAARLAADDLHRTFDRPGHRIFFRGHWGFQYYLQRLGDEAFDPLTSTPRGGDIFIDVRNTTGMEFEASPGAVVPLAERDYPTLACLATMDEAVRAGFYSDGFGPLPYAFGRVPPDQYLIFELHGPLRPLIKSANPQHRMGP